VKFRVLIIDDEPSITRSLTRVLEDKGYDVYSAGSGRAGLDAMEGNRPHIVLLDLHLPDENGLNLIPRILKVESATQVIVLTGFADFKKAVTAMKQGAADFLHKPYDLEELLHAVRTASRTFSRDAHLALYRRKDRTLYRPEEIIYRCPEMIRVWDMARKAARSDSAGVLITGETGTGKELVARAVHFEGGRRTAPFLEINCPSFTEELLENELFGHEPGAYTSARFKKRGLVELSDGGTLFLDEIGDMSPAIQAKILRFLEAKRFRRVGGNTDLNVDIRVVAATNVDLAARIAEKRFRQDLFYRLNVVSIHIPPLRERGEDVNLLADFFLRRYAAKYHKGFRRIEPDVRRILRSYDWPGNVRELKTLFERILLLEDDESVDIRHLPAHMHELSRDMKQRAKQKQVSFHDAGESLHSLREVEDRHILRVLEATEGNKSRAARVLGISRPCLNDRLRSMQDESGEETARQAPTQGRA